MIAGIVVGVVLAASLCCLAALFLLKKRKKQQEDEVTGQEGFSIVGGTAVGSHWCWAQILNLVIKYDFLYVLVIYTILIKKSDSPLLVHSVSLYEILPCPWKSGAEADLLVATTVRCCSDHQKESMMCAKHVFSSGHFGCHKVP